MLQVLEFAASKSNEPANLILQPQAPLLVLQVLEYAKSKSDAVAKEEGNFDTSAKAGRKKKNAAARGEILCILTRLEGGEGFAWWTRATLLWDALCAQLAETSPQHALCMAAELHPGGCPGCAQLLLGRAATVKWVYLLFLAKCCSCCLHTDAPACFKAETYLKWAGHLTYVPQHQAHVCCCRGVPEAAEDDSPGTGSSWHTCSGEPQLLRVSCSAVYLCSSFSSPAPFCISRA